MLQMYVSNNIVIEGGETVKVKCKREEQGKDKLTQQAEFKGEEIEEEGKDVSPAYPSPLKNYLTNKLQQIFDAVQPTNSTTTADKTQLPSTKETPINNNNNSLPLFSSGSSSTSSSHHAMHTQHHDNGSILDKSPPSNVPLHIIEEYYYNNTNQDIIATIATPPPLINQSTNLPEPVKEQLKGSVVVDTEREQGNKTEEVNCELENIENSEAEVDENHIVFTQLQNDKVLKGVALQRESVCGY